MCNVHKMSHRMYYVILRNLYRECKQQYPTTTKSIGHMKDVVYPVVVIQYYV